MSTLLRILSLAFGVLAGLLSAGCANSPTVPASPDILRIGVTANSPPMIFKTGGEYQGLEADFGRALAAEMGRTPRFVDRSWDRLLPSLQAGEVDIVMSNVTITADRSILVDFATPYMQVGQLLLVRSSDYGFYQDPRILAFAEKRIGVEPGTVSDLFVQRDCLKATRVPLSAPEKAIAALTSGRIDVFLSDAPMIWRLSAIGASQGVSMVPTPLGAENLAWAVRRGDTATLKQANAAIARWRANGQLSKMVNRWIPTGQ